MSPPVFLSLFAAVTLYALIKGAAVHRAVALTLTLALIGSIMADAPSADNFRTVQWPLFIIDMIASLALLTIAIVTRLTWVAAMAALQILTTLAHPARALQSGSMNWIYYLLSIGWSYLTVVLLAWATWQRRRARLANAKLSSRGFSMRSFLSRHLR